MVYLCEKEKIVSDNLGILAYPFRFINIQGQSNNNQYEDILVSIDRHYQIVNDCEYMKDIKKESTT